MVIPVMQTGDHQGTTLRRVTIVLLLCFLHFGTPSRNATSDDNTSFISGHSVLGFSIPASAGLICHWRHYWTEPHV